MGDNFDTTTIAEVYESRKTEDVNEHLKLGWKFITTHTYAYGDGISGTDTVYCLGWTKDQGEPTHPERKSRYGQRPYGHSKKSGQNEMAAS